MSPDMDDRDRDTRGRDTAVQLFPTIAYPIDRGAAWRVMVQGRICKQVPLSLAKRLMLRGFIRALELDDEVANGALFGERIQGFLVTPVARERVHVTVASQTHILGRKSKSSGLFTCKLDLPARVLQEYRSYGHQKGDANQKDLRIYCGEGPFAAQGEVFLAQERGVSVISDIDDTIKHTEVCSRKTMLRRTFAEPFASIPGMADVYRNWAESGALFHYVSSSPWQIYDSLYEFLNVHGFPLGSMHLKWFRLRDELFKRWSIIRRKSKAGVIRGLIKRLPERQFVLIGDSGEKDPEMYAKIALKHPKQVARICIRQVSENPLDAARLAKIYRRYAEVVPIEVFTESEQLRDHPVSPSR
jgi:phosphatidate phosphatase APP1